MSFQAFGGEHSMDGSGEKPETPFSLRLIAEGPQEVTLRLFGCHERIFRYVSIVCYDGVHAKVDGPLARTLSAPLLRILMRKLFGLVTFFIAAGAVHADPITWNPVTSGSGASSYSQNDESAYRNSGQSYSTIGDITFGSDGSRQYHSGSATRGSDGSRHNRIGDTTFGSNGTNYQHFGNTTLGSDGTRCHSVGNQTFCN